MGKVPATAVQSSVCRCVKLRLPQVTVPAAAGKVPSVAVANGREIPFCPERQGVKMYQNAAESMSWFLESLFIKFSFFPPYHTLL